MLERVVELETVSPQAINPDNVTGIVCKIGADAASQLVRRIIRIETSAVCYSTLRLTLGTSHTYTNIYVSSSRRATELRLSGCKPKAS